MGFLKRPLKMLFQYALKLLYTLESLILRLPPFLNSYYLALKFLFCLALDIYTSVSETHITLPTSPPISAKVFRPLHQNHRSPPTYLVIHGLSASGYNDKRLIHIATALCGTGATIVVPQLIGLMACEIASERIAEIAAVAEVVARDPILCPRGHVSAISACIAAGFALVATTRTDVIAHALCLGTHASARHVLAHITATSCAAGAYYAVEAALLSVWAKDDPELKAVFHASLADDHHLVKGTDDATLPNMIERYPRAGQVYQKVMGDFSETKKVLEMMYKGNRALWEEVSPILCVERMACQSVTMVHSASDGIVPPHETRLLYEAMRKRNPRIKASMKITDLVDHADKQSFSIAILPELIVLGKTFSRFFQYSWQ